MSLLDELERAKYCQVLDLIDKQEMHDRKRSTITGKELFDICQKRYDTMRAILKPLCEVLGRQVSIDDISVVQGMQDDTDICVKYNADGSKNYFTISKSGYDDYDAQGQLEEYGSTKTGRLAIRKIFSQIDGESLGSLISVKSTSKKFDISDNLSTFRVCEANNRVVSIENYHGIAIPRTKIVTPYRRLEERLTEEKLDQFYRHLLVYEGEVQNILVKK